MVAILLFGKHKYWPLLRTHCDHTYGKSQIKHGVILIICIYGIVMALMPYDIRHMSHIYFIRFALILNRRLNFARSLCEMKFKATKSTTRILRFEFG